ncbi:neuropeptides capa receptor-like, partial [Halyomorpha halys]|uniref:neuropeptides capa receptor-like n=1 Tax=Halyomorpha halys TaxID=286706 RepID=UPI0034D2C12B
MSSLARVLKIIMAAWLVALLCALPFAVYTTVNYIDYPPYSGNILEETAFCAMLEGNIPEWLPIYELSTLLFLIIPIIIIVILYTKIAMKLRDRSDYSLGTEGSVHSRKRHSQSRKPIIRML